MTIYYLPMNMAICLSITIIIEVLVAFGFKVRQGKDFVNIVLVNVLTNPLVVTVPFYFNIYYGVIYRHIALLILEVLATLVEGFVYKKYLKFDKINPYLFSLILNISSYLIGGLIKL